MSAPPRVEPTAGAEVTDPVARAIALARARREARWVVGGGLEGIREGQERCRRQKRPRGHVDAAQDWSFAHGCGPTPEAFAAPHAGLDGGATAGGGGGARARRGGGGRGRTRVRGGTGRASRQRSTTARCRPTAWGSSWPWAPLSTSTHGWRSPPSARPSSGAVSPRP